MGARKLTGDRFAGHVSDSVSIIFSRALRQT